MSVLIIVMLVCILTLAGVLHFISPGKPLPLTDERGNPAVGSISEKIHVRINGIEQGMFIRGRDAAFPVLLFVHGGPGMPEYFLNRTYPTDLEEHFIVCWWDQRGSGLSYRADIPPETMTIEQFIDDTVEVARYLRDRFGKDKIYLMGHSWGSFIGIQAAARSPELFHAYIGVAQISYQLQSENLAYDYMLQQYKANGNTRMARRLEAAPVGMSVPLPAKYDALRDEAMHGLGVGTTRDMQSVVSGIFIPSWKHPEYTLIEKINLWRGKISSRRSGLWNRLMTTDLNREVPELKLPVYIFHGIYDYTVSYPLSRAYFKALKAPVKGFYTFENSAHSPVFEEPVRAREIMVQDVLMRSNDLADTK